ncbi:unnamed protein product [Amoebophrya sp. A120]|nr:unnamed protein product [Amoebophrya sp. A120]|eukprot:GSA120T00003065001.1
MSANRDEAVRLFVAGAAGQGSGKSTLCLGILGALLEMGYSPDELAYIKPCTQGIQQTLVAKFCKAKGIRARHVGPVVFFAGFTQKFATETLPTEVYGRNVEEYRSTLQSRIEEAVDDLLNPSADIADFTNDDITAVKNKPIKVLLIDGVGYPGVGSLCGVSNATTAFLCKSPVLIVGKPGMGDSIDSYEQARSFFEACPNGRVPVLGMIVNRVREGEMKKTSAVKDYFSRVVPKYFWDTYPLDLPKLYGILPENEVFSRIDLDSYAPPGEHATCNITLRPPKPSQLTVDLPTREEEEICAALVANFTKNVDRETLKALLENCGRLQKTMVLG